MNFTFRLSRDLKLKPKGRKVYFIIFEVFIPSCVSLLPFFSPVPPRTLLFPESRVPSPDPAQLPRLRGPVSSDSPNLPAVPRTPPLHSTVPRTPAAHLASPRSASPPGPGGSQRHAPHGSRTSTPFPELSIKSPSGCSRYSSLCLVVWVVPAVHSRPPVSWVFFRGVLPRFITIIAHIWGRMKEEAWRTKPKNLRSLGMPARWPSMPSPTTSSTSSTTLCQTGWHLFCRPKKPIQDINYFSF